MMQHAKYWTKVSLPFDDLRLFPYYYVPAASPGLGPPVRALVWAPLQGPPPLPPPVKNPPASLPPRLHTSAVPTAASTETTMI